MGILANGLLRSFAFAAKIEHMYHKVKKAWGKDSALKLTLNVDVTSVWFQL